MSRNNYGLGSREMSKAGQFALNSSAKNGHLSYSSAATLGDRWSKFSAWARDHDIKKMEAVTAEAVMAYAKTLGDLAPSTAQNYISAVNTVMNLATKGSWKTVSPTKDCQIEKRTHARSAPSPGQEKITSAMLSITDGRMHSVGLLMKELGLRSKEASLINAQKAFKEATERRAVTISEGTKGGRVRELQITRQEQLQALQAAASVQGEHKSMIPPDQSWSKWRDGDLRGLRETLQGQGVARLHDLRAAFANQRFEDLTGHASPLGGGHWDRKLDRQASEKLAEELGHGRIEVLASYIGR